MATSRRDVMSCAGVGPRPASARERESTSCASRRPRAPGTADWPSCAEAKGAQDPGRDLARILSRAPVVALPLSGFARAVLDLGARDAATLLLGARDVLLREVS